MNINTCGQGGIPTIVCVVELIQSVINFAIGAAAIVALFVMVYGGVVFITSNGDKEKVESAKKTLTYGIIGLVLISLVFVIMRIISQITGVNAIL